jgi:hypothetical protein
MNTFKKITRATAIPNTINTAKTNTINIDSIHDFPSLNNKIKTENEINFNFIDATKKKVEMNKQEHDGGLCTIYYDKELKKIVTHNFPKKMYQDNDDKNNYDIDNNSETNSAFFMEEPENIPNIYNIKNPKLHYGMNKTIRGIMERRDKFIDQYGVDEYIRDYLPKDSPYLYSRYYYKNKYMNNHKNKFNNEKSVIIPSKNNVIDAVDVIDSTIENDLILYDDIDLDADIDLDDDIDEEDD